MIPTTYEALPEDGDTQEAVAPEPSLRGLAPVGLLCGMLLLAGVVLAG